MATSKRDHLVDTALALFKEHGFHATGVDRILEASGVARMTLYNNFKSKDELILAALRRQDELFRNELMRQVESREETPLHRLLAIFDVISEGASRPGFCGCTFINACAEYSDLESPAHALAGEHKRLLNAYISELARDAGAEDPERIAQDLSILIDGAMVGAQVTGDAGAVARAKSIAETLLEASLGAPR